VSLTAAGSAGTCRLKGRNDFISAPEFQSSRWHFNKIFLERTFCVFAGFFEKTGGWTWFFDGEFVVETW
jgi:hypothetical protein